MLRWPGMSPFRLRWILPGLLVVGLGVHSIACSMMDSMGTAAETRGPGDGTSSGGSLSDAASPSAGGDNKDYLAPTDNAVILVHAAGMPAYRLCFENEPDLRPQPDQETTPEANVVGVEVGSAVRLAPLRGKPGKIHVFNEALIRAYAGTGLSCK